MKQLVLVLVLVTTIFSLNAQNVGIGTTNPNASALLDTVPAAGNSNTEKRYSYTDQNPQGKFYRVKEVDLDGSFQYSITGVADCGNGYAFRV